MQIANARDFFVNLKIICTFAVLKCFEHSRRRRDNFKFSLGLGCNAH